MSLRETYDAMSKGYRSVPYPMLDKLCLDVAAQVVASLLDKSPMPIVELRVRTRRSERELLDILRDLSGEFGRHLLTYSLDENDPRTLEEAIRCGSSYFFSHVGTAGEAERKELGAFVYRSLLNAGTRLADLVAGTQPSTA